MAEGSKLRPPTGQAGSPSEADASPFRYTGTPAAHRSSRGYDRLAGGTGHASLSAMISRRTLLVGSLVAAAGATLVRRSVASVSLPLSLSELVKSSRHAIVGTPVDLFAQWESLGDHRRIITYTMVRTEYSLDGRPPATREVLVRTLGGIVDGIGQIVPGEAVLRRNAPAAVFLTDVAKDLFAVTGMAQGHYPLVTDPQGVRRLTMSRGAVEVRMTAAAAIKRLDGQSVEDVEKMIHAELGSAAP
jgi:hypothetical protein